MFIERTPEYNNVALIREEGTVEHFVEDEYHLANEGSLCLSESNWHNCVLIESERRTERGIFPVSTMQFDLMVSHCQIERHT